MPVIKAGTTGVPFGALHHTTPHHTTAPLRTLTVKHAMPCCNALLVPQPHTQKWGFGCVEKVLAQLPAIPDGSVGLLGAICLMFSPFLLVLFLFISSAIRCSSRSGSNSSAGLLILPLPRTAPGSRLPLPPASIPDQTSLISNFIGESFARNRSGLSATAESCRKFILWHRRQRYHSDFKGRSIRFEGEVETLVKPPKSLVHGSAD